jgi:uncharacterized membrane protein
MDVLLGTLATLIGAVGGYLLKKHPHVAPIPTVLANAFIVPFVLQFAYGIGDGYLYLMATVGIGEIVCALVGGVALYYALKPHATRLFR